MYDRGIYRDGNLRRARLRSSGLAFALPEYRPMFCVHWFWWEAGSLLYIVANLAAKIEYHHPGRSRRSLQKHIRARHHPASEPTGSDRSRLTITGNRNPALPCPSPSIIPPIRHGVPARDASTHIRPKNPASPATRHGDHDGWSGFGAEIEDREPRGVLRPARPRQAGRVAGHCGR